MTMKLRFPIAARVALWAIGLTLLTPAAGAQTTASSAFADAPQAIFPLLDRNTRLDMIDYFNSGMSTPSANALNGKSRITSLTPEKLTVEMTDASTYELSILPSKGGENAVALITTVATPSPDSRLSVYSADFSNNITDKVFAKPVLADWLTPEGKKNSDEVEMLVPFLLIGYSFDPATSTLTLTNNTSRFLSADVYEIVKSYLLEKIDYKWDGSKFSAK